MIFRKHYRAYLTDENSKWQQALEADKAVVKAAVAAGRCMMAALYKHKNMLFMYVEALEENLEAEIETLIAERQAARKARNFKRADEIRNQLLAQGIILEDTREGVKWKRA